jgi:hypothetical protein
MSLDEPTDVRFTTLEQYVRDLAVAASTATANPRRARRTQRRRRRLRIVKGAVQLDGEGVPLDGTAEAEARRLAFDDDTHTVTLDGVPHKVSDPKAYEVYKTICRRDGATITKREIGGKVKRVAGAKAIPKLIAALPAAVRRTVRSGPAGYWHDLPAAEKSR